jgi:hypothetical protein
MAYSKLTLGFQCAKRSMRRLVAPLAGAILIAAGGAACTGGSGDPGGQAGTVGATGGHPVIGGSTGAGNTGGSGGSSEAGRGGAPALTGSGGMTTGLGGGSGGVTGQAGSGGSSGGASGTAGSAGGSGNLGGGGVPGLAGAGGKSTGTGGATTSGPSYPYIFSVFNDSAPLSDLMIYTSNDALNFTLLYDTKYVGPTGFLRDPSIMKHTDGRFYVAFTTPPTLGCCGADASFSIASSANLKDWTTVTTVPAGIAGVKNTWAPEWFKDRDGSIYALVNVDGKTYSYKAMNDSLTVFSAPTWIGIGPGYIDTFVVTVGDTYHAFTKGSAYIEHATATSLNGPWTFVGMGDWAGWGTHKEAPALIQLADGTWRFYCDAGSTGHETYSDSADMFQTWTAPKTLPAVGNNISHGTVIHGD